MKRMAVELTVSEARGSILLVPRGLTSWACHFQIVAPPRDYFISLDAYTNYLTIPVDLGPFDSHSSLKVKKD
jgi:hypothetical protein